MIRAVSVAQVGSPPVDTVTLSYDDRFRRRMTLTGDGGVAFLLDLPKTTLLHDGDLLILEDGRTVAVRAADEDVMEVRGPDQVHLIRAAWHIGNRHLPCEVHAHRLVLRWDHVIAAMLEGLGCAVLRQTAPFTPEGGAYGHGRTHGHDHDHDHGHAG